MPTIHMSNFLPDIIASHKLKNIPTEEVTSKSFQQHPPATTNSIYWDHISLNSKWLISTPAVEFWNLGVEFSNSNLLNSTPKFHNSTAGVEISPLSNSYLYDPNEFFYLSKPYMDYHFC